MSTFISALPRRFFDSEELQYFGRGTFEFGQGDIADIADFSSSFVGGIVAAHGQVAILGEEASGVFEFAFRFREVANVVADFELLRLREIVKRFLETLLGLVVDPLESGENDFAITNLIRVGSAHPFVDKVGHLQLAGAGGVAYFGENNV